MFKNSSRSVVLGLALCPPLYGWIGQACLS